MRVRRLLVSVAAVLAFAAVGFVVRSALSGDEDPGTGVAGLPYQPGTKGRFSQLATRTSGPGSGVSLIATARGRSIPVFRHRGGGSKRVLRQRIFEGQRIPLTFLVRSRRPGWVHVDLPTRPNLSKGYIRSRDVAFSTTRLRVVVHVKGHRLELHEGHRLLLRTKIGVGRSLSPTPKGRYYLTDIVKPRIPNGFFGPYSLGLSAHSNVFTSFEGGDGQVGIHGTNAPKKIGRDVSHGCVRVRNDVIARLARRLPLGTPVRIER